MQLDRELERSIRARFDGLFRRERLASDMSALTRVMMILAHPIGNKSVNLP